MMSSIQSMCSMCLRTVGFKNVVCHKMGKIFEKKVHFQANQGLIQYWKKKMEIYGVPDPEESVKWIKEHVKKLVAENKKKGEEADILFQNEFKKLCKRRIKREPVQYIVGDWDFRSINLSMKEPVFIPRPETEGLIDLINDYIKSLSKSRIKILEIGCGSGAISLSLAKENDQVKCTAIDVSEDAVKLSKENSSRLGLSSRVSIYNLSFDQFVGEREEDDKFDVLVSNPPYIPTKDMKELQPEISQHEDLRALHGGEDGLDIIKQILSKAHLLLLDSGSIWLEVDTSHPSLIKKLIDDEFGGKIEFLETCVDIYGRPRFCQLQMSSS
eukprot:Seg2163.4 transcript_id=Seg2163.4/GoldUCD/mRNA.D3Y31 product="HemK methyltransferase family member 1" protein_id=Seg2163.4/GoldUCD/D3Y31